MNIARLFFLFLFSAALFPYEMSAQTDSSNGNLRIITLINGSNALLLPLVSVPNTELTLQIIAGGLYENDSMNGIAHVVQNAIAKKINKRIAGKNITLQSFTTSERSIFKLVLPADQTDFGLSVFTNDVLNASFDEKEIATTVNSVLSETELEKQDPKKVFADEMLKRLFKKEYEQLKVGNANELKKIDLNAVKRFHKRYYAVNNSILIATGNFDYATLQKQFETSFKPLFKSEFDPETITHINHFRSMIYTSQFIVEDSTVAPEFQICRQFPGTNSNQQVSYCAYLLTSMLNDKNNFIQVKAAKLGCKKFVAEYEANNFNGVLKISLQPDEKNFYTTYKLVTDELARLETTLVNEVMMNAAKLQFKTDFENLKHTKIYPEKIAALTAYKDNSYFQNLADSVFSVTEKRLKTFVIEYMNLSPHVTGLLISKSDREKLQIDSVFTDLNESIGDSVFRYRQNITDLEGEQNQKTLRNLLQWLLINKDVDVQVNGYADKREYEKVKDKSVKDFIDSIPTFSRVRKQLIEKGYLRPEMMRAVKIVKYLYENGIAADRLSGTAMVFSSSSDAEAEENQKCTVTLNKLHRTMPLREYHYGKQKE